MNRRVTGIVAILAVALVASLLITALRNRGAESYDSYTQEIMGTQVTVMAPDNEAADVAEIVFDIFRETDLAMSEWKSDSPLTAVNQAAGLHPVEVPVELLAVVRQGIEIGELTDGAFDITWAALWGTWDFKAATPKLPSDELLRTKLALVNYRDVDINEELRTVYLPRPDMLIGLGGIAKGTALKRAVNTLRDQGFASFLISAGGQVAVHGTRHGRPWRIGIRDPRGDPDDYFARLNLDETSAATSGDYERFFILDGVRYHHILDPRTGMPTLGLRSVTVICADAERADALSTAMMVLGMNKALALAARLDDVEVVLVDAGGEVFLSAGVADLLEIQHSPSP